MKHIDAPDRERLMRMTSAEVRASFLLNQLFVDNELTLVSTNVDRAIVGAAVPISQPVLLHAPPALRAEHFADRRELGVLNIGGRGRVTADDQTFDLDRLDVLYVGRGTRVVTFTSMDARTPARYYLLSYPAHAAHPTALVRKDDAERTDLGGTATANQRTILKHIHPRGVASCQLVMGVTLLAEGSVWNTMPPHTHARRTEVYFYFDLPANGRVFHFLGAPDETRHVVVGEGEAVLAPPWSLHMGCGSGAYAFCWGMGGENQNFEDMDPAPLDCLR